MGMFPEHCHQWCSLEMTVKEPHCGGGEAVPGAQCLHPLSNPLGLAVTGAGYSRGDKVATHRTPPSPVFCT